MYNSRFQQVYGRSRPPSAAQEFVPIEISVEHNGQKHSLKLIWNFNDKDVSADEIASVIVQDLKLPQNLEQDVLLQIQKPLQSH